MGCYKCLCNFCANNCELPVDYITAGECEEPCFNCDECRHYDGDFRKRSKWTTECPKYKEAKKHEENHRRMENIAAERRRKNFVVINCSKEE